MKKNFSLIITATPDKKLAEKIASSLVKKKLSACVQLLPIQSLYTWKKRFQKEKEILLFIKTRTDKFPAIERLIKKLHFYQLPEIIELKISKGNKKYLEWLAKNTKT
jgi:periplasmic divalent cation tolerance protein